MSFRIVEAIDPEFGHEYERCRSWLVGALEHGGELTSEKTLIRRLLAGECVLWAGENSAFVSEVRDEDTRRVCFVWLVAGDMAELMEEGDPLLVEWAKDDGCEEITTVGRKGWERALKKYGYALASVQMSKRI